MLGILAAAVLEFNLQAIGFRRPDAYLGWAVKFTGKGIKISAIEHVLNGI